MYSIRTKKDTYPANFDSWQEWCDFVNEEMRYAKTIDYTDYKNHTSINLLPGFHPYWQFKTYLHIKSLYVRNGRTIETHKNMLKGDALSIENRGRVSIYIYNLERIQETLKLAHKQHQSKIIKQ